MATKDIGNPAATGRALQPEQEFVSRKLIRPALRPVEAKPEAQSSGAAAAPAPRRERPEKPRKSGPAPDQTFAENFYFQKQIQSKTLMTLVLINGDEVQGTLEWYDKNCIKLNRAGKPNLLLYKQAIRYMYKSGDTNGR